MVSIETIIQVNTSGNIIGMGISEDIYMRDYAENYCEWLDGTVIKISPVHDKHDQITRYLAILFEAYFEVSPIAQIKQEPFVMRYSYDDNGETKRRNREPDIQVILDDNAHNLTPIFMNGAAYIVIEVVSLESQQRDYAEKYHEYEQAGVSEYWIINPLKKDARFYQLNHNQAYVLQDAEISYQTDKLPKLQIDIATFWQDKLPGPSSIVSAINSMMAD